MKKNKDFLIIIPARSGSKRIKNKNIVDLNGKPLIYYTIKNALDLRNICDHIFTTDSHLIRKTALEYGAYAPFLRPESLATDEITNIQVMDHAIEYLKNHESKEYKYYILLQPTSPFRKYQDVLKAIDNILEANVDTLASVSGPYQKRHQIFKKKLFNNNLLLENAFDINQEIYKYNASIYIVRKKFFSDNLNIHSSTQAYYRMSEYCIDIDTPEDLEVARVLMNSKMEFNKN